MKIVLVILFFCFSAFSTISMAQQTKPGMMQPGMTSKCEEMMKMHQEMQTKMKQMDQDLSDLGQKMNQAKGDQKIQAMEAVLNEMIAQRIAMRATMMTHDSMMMEHMGEHMQKDAGSMMQCPMMKEMQKETKEKDKHMDHQPGR